LQFADASPPFLRRAVALFFPFGRNMRRQDAQSVTQGESENRAIFIG
jgi:hypothetical protein